MLQLKPTQHCTKYPLSPPLHLYPIPTLQPCLVLLQARHPSASPAGLLWRTYFRLYKWRMLLQLAWTLAEVGARWVAGGEARMCLGRGLHTADAGTEDVGVLDDLVLDSNCREGRQFKVCGVFHADCRLMR